MLTQNSLFLTPFWSTIFHPILKPFFFLTLYCSTRTSYLKHMHADNLLLKGAKCFNFTTLFCYPIFVRFIHSINPCYILSYQYLFKYVPVTCKLSDQRGQYFYRTFLFLTQFVDCFVFLDFQYMLDCVYFVRLDLIGSVLFVLF